MEQFLEDNVTWLHFEPNISNSTQSVLRHSKEWTAVFVLIYVLIFLTGLLGNGMLVIMLYRKRQIHTVAYTFIFNLAIADLLVIVLCVPATLAATVFTPWLLGSLMCKAMPYVQGVSVCASAYSLVAISIDRCQGIYRPMQRGQGFSKSRAHVCILFIWFTSLVITIPWLFVFQVVPDDDTDEGPFCVELWENPLLRQIYYIVFTLISCYALPILLISICNLLIWWKVSRRKLPLNAASTTTISKLHRKTKAEVRRMLTLVTFTFLLCWLPLYLLVSRVSLFKHNPIDDSESRVLNIMIPLAQLLGSFNSCVNPIIYAFVNTKFRKMFCSVLPFNRQSPRSSSFRRRRLPRSNTIVLPCATNGMRTVCQSNCVSRHNERSNRNSTSTSDKMSTPKGTYARQQCCVEAV